MSPEDRIVITHGHDDLTSTDLASLAALFDAEYRASFGPWSPEHPYGYAGHNVHILARRGGRIIGHAGFQRRRIAAGSRELTIAGVGGVLVAPEVRGTGLGTQLMDAAAAAMRSRTAHSQSRFLTSLSGIIRPIVIATCVAMRYPRVTLGSSMVTTQPGGLFRIWTLPKCAATMVRTMGRPSPLPEAPSGVRA